MSRKHNKKKTKMSEDMSTNSNETSAKAEEQQQEQAAEVAAEENAANGNVEEEAETDAPKAETADDEAEEGDDAEKLKAQLEEANAQLADLKDKYLRLSAEFDNYRKRTLKEKAELILNGGEKTIKAILPVIDDLERALQNMAKTTDVDALKEGVEIVYNKFMQILGQNGVKAIDTKEKPLDTDYHEAVAMIDAPKEELKGKVLDCVQTGYTLNEKVIRHAKVVVGK